ncbi:BrnT family toxin [Botrimarina sp.]|uniref:BrnT family toxin n=1 Tax=Botrimarina sp. TaxID=2795802 RepID=UPI0032F06923
MEFEWDRQKASLNLRKHGVSFREASTVFGDPLGEFFDDVDHSDYEERAIVLGQSDRGRLLVVSFTDRDGVARLISARRASRTERERYENG